jgi:hypothetical protein
MNGSNRPGAVASSRKPGPIRRFKPARSPSVATCREIGIDWRESAGWSTASDYMQLQVLEDTPTLHHVIVCTLCACCPWRVLGYSPY